MTYSKSITPGATRWDGEHDMMKQLYTMKLAHDGAFTFFRRRAGMGVVSDVEEDDSDQDPDTDEESHRNEI